MTRRNWRDGPIGRTAESLRGRSGLLYQATRHLLAFRPEAVAAIADWSDPPLVPGQAEAAESALLKCFAFEYRRPDGLWNRLLPSKTDFAEEVARAALLLVGFEWLSERNLPVRMGRDWLIAERGRALPPGESRLLRAAEALPEAYREWLRPRLVYRSAYATGAAGDRDFLRDEIGLDREGTPADIVNGLLMLLGLEVAERKATPGGAPTGETAAAPRGPVAGTLWLVLRSRGDAPPTPGEPADAAGLLTRAVYFRCQAGDAVPEGLRLTPVPEGVSDRDVLVGVSLSDAGPVAGERNPFRVRQHLADEGSTLLTRVAGLDTAASAAGLGGFVLQ